LLNNSHTHDVTPAFSRGPSRDRGTAARSMWCSQQPGGKTAISGWVPAEGRDDIEYVKAFANIRKTQAREYRTGDGPRNPIKSYFCRWTDLHSPVQLQFSYAPLL